MNRSSAAPGSVVVAVAGRGKTLFESLKEPRVAVVWSPPPEGLEPDFLAIPYPQSVAGPEQYADFDAYVAELPADLVARVARGRTGLIFDASAEGPLHSPALTDWLHAGLAARGVPLANCIYITQERNHAQDYARYCRQIGCAEPMRVLNYDLWIKRFHAQFDDSDAPALLARRLKGFRARDPLRRSRRFLSLNLTARSTKVLFLLRLLKDGLWSSGFISFGGFDRKAKHDAKTAYRFLKKEMRREAGFEDLVAELAPQLPLLEAEGPLLLGPMPRDKRGRLTKTPITETPLKEYDTSWFSVVTETEMRERPSRITEKPFKAMASLHPFLVLGNPGSLKMIRDFGYQTFGGIFDESYDDELDPRRRFEMVYREFRRLCAMPEAELAQLVASISDVLIFNAQRAMIDMPRIYREELDVALVDQLLAARHALVPPAPV